LVCWRSPWPKDFTELIAWQLAEELNVFIHDVTKRPGLAQDFKFRDQANDAGDSAPRNIAEGFGRFAPTQFAQFLRIAIASEFETKNHIIRAARRGFLTSDECNFGLRLAKRSITAAIRLRRYQLTKQAQLNARAIEQRQLRDLQPELTRIGDEEENE
jgi:four helix bundle protein